MATNEGEEGPFRREGAITSVSAKQHTVYCVSVVLACRSVFLYTEEHQTSGISVSTAGH